MGQISTKLKTIGDHIRKHRLDLGLKQKEVSRIIDVTRAMISAWEMNPVEPAVKHIPKIIEFLGYVPYERGEFLEGTDEFAFPESSPVT